MLIGLLYLKLFIYTDLIMIVSERIISFKTQSQTSFKISLCCLTDPRADMIMADGISNLCNDLRVNLANVFILFPLKRYGFCLKYLRYRQSSLKNHMP